MNFRDVLFWIFLVISLVLLVWKVFGNSPSEFITLITIIFMVVLKLWSVSDRQIRHEMRVNNSFSKLGRDMDLVKKKLKV